MQTSQQNFPDTILFYDGVCNFCDGAVQFVLRHDRRQKFSFAPLQSPVSQQMLQAQGFEQIDMDTLVLWHRGKVFTRSAAVLEIADILGGLFSIAAVFRIVPTFLRDFLYRFFARNRYRWFGKKAECSIPTPSQRARFLAV